MWNKYGREVFGIEYLDNPIISQDPELHGLKINVSKNKIGRPKMRDVEMFPFFETKEEAEVFIDLNNHWRAVSVNVEIPHLIKVDNNKQNQTTPLDKEIINSKE